MARRAQPRVVYANLSEEEYTLVVNTARREGLTISNFLRRCINGYLLDEGAPDGLLIVERDNGRQE